MRHNRLLAACFAAGLAVAATGCSAASTGGANGDVTLTYLVFETPDLTASFWNTSISNAEKQVPGLTVKKIVSPNTDRDAYAKQLQASGQFPDLLQSITPSTFAPAGLLQPYPQSWVNANFLDPTGNAYKGKVYIPPTNSQIIPMVFYNKKLFAQAGISTLPKTWAQFMDDCAKLKGDGITPIELGGGDSFAAAMPMTGALSVDVLGKDPNWLQQRYAGKVHFTDPDVETAVGKYVTMVQDGYFEQGALSVSYADSITDFLKGDAAMYMMGSWFLGSIPKAGADNFGSFLTPSDSGSAVVPYAVGGSMAISAKTPSPDKATAFAEAWSLNPANLSTLITGDGAFPLIKGKTLADYGVQTSQVYKDSYAYVLQKNDKVSAIGWATNDDAMPSGLNDDFYAAAQALYNSTDVAGQMAKLDSDWDTATQ
ncbi:MAG TPA: extracellular solute-binding protein [Actinocrinis sp.]|jgi:multiple sugar transport system substrate-binding protein/raffinose/stachyose/melibiose transport system substrate-binding protein